MHLLELTLEKRKSLLNSYFSNFSSKMDHVGSLDNIINMLLKNTFNLLNDWSKKTFWYIK